MRRPPTVIQASSDGGSDDDLKWLDSGCSLKVRLTDLLMVDSGTEKEELRL